MNEKEKCLPYVYLSFVFAFVRCAAITVLDTLGNLNGIPMRFHRVFFFFFSFRLFLSLYLLYTYLMVFFSSFYPFFSHRLIRIFYIKNFFGVKVIIMKAPNVEIISGKTKTSKSVTKTFQNPVVMTTLDASRSPAIRLCTAELF